MNNDIMLALGSVFGLGLLYYGADWLVRGGSAIAARAHVSPLVVGLTLVAFGTSAPELFVSVGAAHAGLGDICIGNVIGSNTCNIALILGISAFIAPLTVHPDLLRRDIPIMIAAAVAVTGFCVFGSGLGRLVGLLFVAGIVSYTAFSVASTSGKDEERGVADLGWTKAIVLSLGGLGALVGGAKLLLVGAVAIEKSFGVPDEVVALTVVAVGTSLPELATSVVAARKGASDIAIGNVVGSNIFNVLGILGISALVRPVQIDGMDGVDFAVMIAVSVLLWLVVRKKGRLGRKEGVLFLSVYALYLVWLFKSMGE